MKSMLTITVCMALYAGTSLAVPAHTYSHRHTVPRLPQSHRLHRPAHASHTTRTARVRHRRHRSAMRGGHAASRPERLASIPRPAAAASAVSSRWHDVFQFTPGVSRGELSARPPEPVDFSVLRGSLANRGVTAFDGHAGAAAVTWVSNAEPLRQTLWLQALPASAGESTLFVSAPAYFGLHY